MPEKIGRLIFWGGCALLVLATMAFHFWSMAEVWTAVSSSTMAAWVQAVGSFAAIYAAFYIGQLQLQNALRLEESNQTHAQRRRFKALLAFYRPVQQVFAGNWKDLIEMARDGPVDETTGFAEHVKGRVFFIPHVISRVTPPLTKYLKDVDPFEYGEAAPSIVELSIALERLVETADALNSSVFGAGSTYPYPEAKKAAAQLWASFDWCTWVMSKACRHVGLPAPQWLTCQMGLLEPERRRFFETMDPGDLG